MKLFAGSGCPMLAMRIAQALGVPLSSMDLSHFNDGELGVAVDEHVRGEDVYIIQSTSHPANDNIMQLAIIADAMKRADAGRVVAVIPYYGYARQDRRPNGKRSSITSRLVADILQIAGVTNIVTVDIHSTQQEGFFNVPYTNLSATNLLVQHITRSSQPNVLVVSPDLGGVVRARAVASGLGNPFDLAIVDKRRPAPGVAEVMNIIGEVKNRHCVLIDDMVDTAGTLCLAAKALKGCGALTVSAYATHPVLSGAAIENIAHSVLDRVVVTDTIPLTSEAEDLNTIGKITVVSAAPLLSEAIRRLNTNQSLSEMD